MEINNRDIKYILYQRTRYLKENKLFRLLNKIEERNHRLGNKLKRSLFKNEIKKEFEKDIINDFNTIKSCLPKSATNILDIGCGMGSINTYLYKMYSGKSKIFLIDKTRIDNKIKYNYRLSPSFYNSLKNTKEFLINNGIKKEDIKMQEATDDGLISFKVKFDLVISILSCGFHYPIDIYLDNIYKSMNKKGVLIIDVRNTTDGMAVLKKKFGNVNVVHKGTLFERVKCIKE